MPVEKFRPRLPGLPLAEGEVEEPAPPREPPPPLPPPPVQPEEYYPGYKRQFVATGELAARAAERVQAAQQRMQELQSQYGVRMFWEIPHRGTWSFPLLPFVQFQFTPKEEFARQREEAQVELDAATREFSRFSWRQNLMMSLPYMLADPESDVRTLEDVMRELPNEYLLEGDRRWLEETFSKFEYLIPDVLPEGFVGDTGEVRERLLEDILAEPKTEFKAVHNMTVEELMRSVQPISAEIPPGMTTEDVRGILTDLEFDEETQQEIFSIRATARILRTDWQEQAAYITLVRDGLLSPEAPELTPWEFTKMLFTQPALATIEMLDKYFNILSRPLAAWAVIHFPRLNPESDAAELERLYEEYREQGTDSWEAYSKAYQDWGTNWVLKMFIETMFDPTTYIGIGLATKITKPIPYVGRFVGALERGWNELWDIPFRGLRRVIKAIPKTPTQRAISYARQAFMDTRAFMRRFTGKDLQGITVPEIKESMEFAVKQAMERPYETGDLAVRVGRYLTDYDFITDTVTRDWVRLAGGEGAQLTQQVVHDVNMQFDMFFRKTLNAKEASTNILASIGVEATEKNIGVLAKNLERHSKKIVDTAVDAVKGDTAKDVLAGLLRSVEDMQVRKALSPAYQYALKTGRATAWAGRLVDTITRNSILAKIDRLVVAPMANQYLLFTNYGPFNILESAMRSFLGGGELLYPRAASPVDELVRLGEGLTSLPYEFVSFQRELGRLEMAVIDPKTNKTMVFSRGKIPGLTKEIRLPEKLEKLLPDGDIGIAGVGVSREGAFIEIGGKRYPIRSWQNWNDMFGDIGTKQRAYYVVTKYKQFLGELAPDQIDQIAGVFEKNQHLLDEVGSISKAEKRDLVRVLEQDATVGPDMIRAHDIPLAEVERRRALREINKTLDKCTDIYSPHKGTIREQVLDGSIWRDIDGSIDAIRESVREFNIISLRSESNALSRLVSDLADFAPANSDELLRTMGFVSDIVDGITERISEVRVMTRARAAKLVGTEADDFHKASSDLLADFLGKSQDDIGKMLDNITTAMTRSRTLLDDLTRNIKFGKSVTEGLTDVGFRRAPIILDGEDVGSLLYRKEISLDDLVVDEIAMARPGVLDRGFMEDIELLIHNLAREEGMGKVFIVSKAGHKLLYERAGYTRSAAGYVKKVMKPKPPLKLTPVQTERLSALTDAIRLRHANAVATRDLDRQIINEAIEQTPKKKRTKEWWEWLDDKRSREAWEPYWKQEETLFNQVEDLKLGMMDSLGVDITVPPQMPDVVGQLAPAHVAYLMGITGDDMYKALTKVGAMTVIRPKNRFVAWVYRRANKAAARVGKTPEEIGFSREAISDVHDQMFRAVGIDPNFAVNEPLTPAMLQLEDVRQELVRINGVKAMPDADFVKFKRYLSSTADDLEKTGIYTDGFTNLREESMMKARTQYEIDFTDYDNRNMVDAAMRMIYPFWCTPESTKILTRTGWKHYKELQVGEDVLTTNPKTLITEWQPVQEIAEFDYDDSLMVIPAKGKDILFTPNHRWLTVTPRNLEPQIKRGYELTDGYDMIPRALPHQFPEESVLSPRLAAILGWTCTDGYIANSSYRKPQLRIYQNRHKYIDDIEATTGTRAYPRSKVSDPDNMVVGVSQEDSDKVLSVCPNWSYLPNLVTLLSKEAAEFMWRAMSLAEGNWDTAYNGKEFFRFKQNPGPVSEAFQILSVLLGKAITVGKCGNMDIVTVLSNNKPYQAKQCRRMRAEHYKGKVWCPVTANGTWFANFNGSILPTGNTYEWQRWFWLPRAMLRTPGIGTGLGRYMDYSDQGYIPVPGTDIQFNPTRGTVFMGGFRRLMLRDYPEYYDAFPGMEIIDFISRMGFYPGIHVMLPISITGAAVGKPEWSEVLPAWAKTGFNAARAVSPELAGKTLDHVFPDRFRDYLTMLTLGGQGYDADEIWRKRKAGVALTEEEEKLWLRAEAKATGLKGILMEQTGLFRIRPPEYTQFRIDGQKLIEDMTGVPVDVQEAIQRRYAVTGKRLSDYYKLDSLQQKIVYEMDAYQRWQGVTTALYPSTWQMEDIALRDYYEKVEQLYDDYRSVGIFDEEGEQLAIGISELTRQWVDGIIGPDQWITARAELLTQASAAVREIGKRDYPDVPKTLDERAARYEERGIPAPVFSPDQELMYMYFDIRPELKFSWESGRMEYDYDTYFAKIDAILETLSGEFSQRLLDRIQYSWNEMEKLYWTISREFLRPYRMVRSVVMEQYTDEQVQQIRRFEVARGAEREELKEIIGPDGLKLISHFQSTVREARLRLRYIDPELDAWCYFFGITDKLITAQGQEVYDSLTERYMRPEMAR